MFEKTMVRALMAALVATVGALAASGHGRTLTNKMKRLLAVLAAVLLLNCAGSLAATDVIDKSPDLGAGWEPIGYLDTQVYADSFVAPISGPVTELGTWLKEYNDGSCNVTFQVYGSIDGNAANGPDISDVYATTGIVSGLSPSALTYYQFSPLSGGTPLILGDTYWFGINAIGATSGRYQVGNHTQNSGGIVDNGTFWYSNSPPVFDGKNLTPEIAFSVSVTPATEPSSAWAAAVSGSWSNAGNWSGGVPNAIGTGAVINASTTAALTITVDAPQTLGTLLLGNSAAARAGYTLNGAGSNTLTLNNSGNGATITVTNGTHAINTPVVLNDNLTVSNSGSLTIGGTIANGSNGAMGITISCGLVVFAGGNTYSGNTTISGGTLTLAHLLAVQNSTVNVTNSGTLSFAAGNTGPTLGGLTGAGNVALATAAAEPVALNVGQNSQSTTYGGILSGVGSLTKQGAGTLTLTSASSYSGPTVISGGAIILQAPAAGGSVGIHFIGDGTAFSGTGGVVPMSNWNNESGYTFSGGTLAANNGNNSGATFSLNGATSVWGTGSTNQLLNGYVAASNYSPMTLTIGSIPYARYSIYVYVGDSSVGNQEEATINGTTCYYATLGGSPTTYTAITSNSPTNYQSGNYIEVDGLTGGSQAVQIAGTTQQFGGLCSMEIVSTAPTGPNINILPATTALLLASGGTLDLSGGSQQATSLSDQTPGSGGSIVNSSTAASLLTLAPNGSTTFSGTIQGGGTLGTIALAISGSGRQTLSGSNTYSGTTTINQGKLVVDGWLTNSAVSVNGGTLGGTGYLSSVTVNAGGQLAPGDPQGVLSISGNLILESSAGMDYELDGVSTDDEVSVSGNLALTNQQFSNFNFTPLSGFRPGTYDLIAFGTSSGSLGSNSGTVDGYAATLAVQGNDLVLNVVPEPGTLALFGAAVVGLLGWTLRKRVLRSGPLVALLFSVLVQDALGQVQYTVTDLGTLPGYTHASYAYGVNNNGQVVGYAENDSYGAQAFLYSGGTMQDLGTPGLTSEAAALNNSGQVVGQGYNSGGLDHAFLYSGGTVQDLGTLGGPYSVAYGINNSGQIAGYAWIPGHAEHAFLYSGGTMQDLGTLGTDSYNSIAYGINDSGQVVGCSIFGAGASQHAFLYSGGTMQDLNPLPSYAYQSQANGINDRGQIVGWFENASTNTQEQAFLYSGGSMQNLGMLPGYTLQDDATGINESGWVVGWAEPFSGYDHAFLYANGTLEDLNSLIDPSSGWTLLQAEGINDNGQIVGCGINPSGQTDAFLLTPTPEPSTFALLGVGALGLAGYAWRRRKQTDRVNQHIQHHVTFRFVGLENSL